LPYDIGYSDHTLGIAVSLAATALGAKVIEKHFTQSSALPGPDHSCSLEPVELAKLVEGIRTVSTALGSKQKDLQVVEEDVRLAVTKIIIATKTIHKGMLFSPENITLIRTGDIGISGFGWDSLLGRQAMRSYRAYEPIDPLETIKI
jgi:sialic acid synthase SpsE